MEAYMELNSLEKDLNKLALKEWQRETPNRQQKVLSFLNLIYIGIKKHNGEE